MAAGVNFLPWTGPTLRAAAALKTSTTEIFRPLIAVQAVGLAFVFAAAWWLGRREAHRLGARGVDAALEVAEPPSPAVLSDGHQASRRPRNFWANLTLTLVVVGVMVAGLASPAVVFMLGTATALIINYPGSASQRERVDAHARSALSMAAILLAAGAFTGVMSGTGALKALAQSVVAHVPAGAGRHLPFGLALIAMPLSLLFDPDSFYFGVLPVIAETYRQLGGEPLHMAQAALVGQMTAGFPISPLTPATFLVAGLAGVDLSAHQRFAFPFLYAASLVMAVACVFLRVFSA
jgi:CitMHS family citrate-Mg2+:H+ or citrate-Ca2+:H+ symporter